MAGGVGGGGGNSETPCLHRCTQRDEGLRREEYGLGNRYNRADWNTHVVEQESTLSMVFISKGI